MRAEGIVTTRLELTPLRQIDAAAMFSVLDDQRLHAFTGGRPRTLAELRDHYGKLVAGASPDGNEAWLNWIVRLHQTKTAIGTVQAGVEDGSANVAWIIGVPWQGQGYAVEAATAMVAWLAAHDVHAVKAAIHPEHAASAGVARRGGLSPTAEVSDGEVIWRNDAAGALDQPQA